ncbi:MAG: tetratricopeptide repeat protein [Thermodesulfobacteriota bacterium]
MNFAHPYLLLSLWAAVPLLLIVFWGGARRKKILAGFAAANGLVRIAADASPARRTAAGLLLILASASALVALSGPRYGFRWEKIEQRGVDIMVALDCSRSMLAEDIKPTRLTRAKYEIIDLLRMLTGDRVGLVAFAGSAFLQCPLTMDYSAFHLFLDTLSPDMLPVGGTAIGDAVQTAISGFHEKDASDKAIIIITDGESTAGADPLEAARQAAEKKIRIFCIGVGGNEGAPVPEAAGGFKKDREGKIVLTRLDEETLKQMAAATGGIYVRSEAGDMDLENIYQDRIRGTMEQTTLESGRKKIWEDRFQWFLALALLLLAVEMFLPRGRKAGPAVLLVMLLAVSGASEVRAGNVYDDVRQGREAYDGGQYDQALKHFIDAQLADPDNAELYYNIGSAYYKAGKQDEAVAHYKKALELIRNNEPFRENVWYNLGNAHYRRGDFTSAIDAYQQALKINAGDREAEENLALARKAEEEKNKQQNQDQQKQSSDQDKQKTDQEQQQHQSGQDQNQASDQNKSSGENQPQSSEQNRQQQAGQQPEDEGQRSDNGGDDQLTDGQNIQQESQPDQQSGGSQAAGGGDQEPEQEQAAGKAMAGRQPGADPGDNRLNRLQDRPGAIMLPEYRKKEVEQDW